MNKSFDVFLSHNSKDKPAVRELAETLRARGLKVWLDEWELVPGRPWQESLEEVIATTGAAAVLVGKEGLGPWQDAEMRGCLSEFESRNLPVIPVLLPGAPEIPRLPLFLQRFSLVDLRVGLTEEGIDRLQWGVTGERPVGSTPSPPLPPTSEMAANRASASETQPRPVEETEAPCGGDIPTKVAQDRPMQAILKRLADDRRQLLGLLLVAVAPFLIFGTVAKKSCREEEVPPKKRMTEVVPTEPMDTESRTGWVLPSPISLKRQILEKQTFKRELEFEGRLSRGTKREYTVYLKAGRDYRFEGSCDPDCIDLNLNLWKPYSSYFVTEDRTYWTLSNNPQLAYSPSSSSTFKLYVQMHSCSVNPCSYTIFVSSRKHLDRTARFFPPPNH